MAGTPLAAGVVAVAVAVVGIFMAAHRSDLVPWRRQLMRLILIELLGRSSPKDCLVKHGPHLNLRPGRLSLGCNGSVLFTWLLQCGSCRRIVSFAAPILPQS